VLILEIDTIRKPDGLERFLRKDFDERLSNNLGPDSSQAERRSILFYARNAPARLDRFSNGVRVSLETPLRRLRERAYCSVPG
jgi:hypothetical protein